MKDMSFHLGCDQSWRILFENSSSGAASQQQQQHWQVQLGPSERRRPRGVTATPSRLLMIAFVAFCFFVAACDCAPCVTKFSRARECLPVMLGSARDMRKALQTFSHSGQAGQQGAHKMVMEELHKRGQGCGGTFVELGSLDGVSHANTRLLEGLMGWSGLCIEGNPIKFEQLQVTRPHCYNVPAVIGSEAREVEYWAMDKVSPGLSGVREFYKPAHAARVERELRRAGGDNWQSLRTVYKLQMRPIADILSEAAVDHIDLFVLDVEGAEAEILRGFPFDRVSVGLWMVEANFEEDKREIRRILNENGYTHFSWLGQDWVASKNPFHILRTTK